MTESTATLSNHQSLPALHAYQRQFTDYLRDPLRNDVFPKTLPIGVGIYARLLHNKIDGSLRACFPVAREILGARNWQRLVQAFIREHRCQSPLYREIPDEFIAYLLHDEPQLQLPVFFNDLAHYEWMELTLETAKPDERGNIVSLPQNPLTCIPAVNTVLHLLHYRYPVHRIAASDKYWQTWGARDRPYAQQDVILVGYRDRDFTIQFIEVNAVTARLIELLQAQFFTGEQALLLLAGEMHYSDPASILPFGLEILQQLQAQQIILGAFDV